MYIRIIFTFIGMFVLYLKTFCLGKFNGGNHNFENWCHFSLGFAKNSKIHVRDMIFQKRTIIMGNEDDHESCILTQFPMATF